MTTNLKFIISYIALFICFFEINAQDYPNLIRLNGDKLHIQGIAFDHKKMGTITLLAQNNNIRKIIVTTKTKLGQSNVENHDLIFVPSAIYAYWVSDFLYRNKKRELLFDNK